MTKRGSEQRHAPRRRLRIPVHFWNDSVDAKGFTADLSDRGAYIETRTALSVGNSLHLEFSLKTRTFFAECIVARIVKVPSAARSVLRSGFGIRFVGLGEVIREISAARSRDAPFTVDLRSPDRLGEIFKTEITLGGLFVDCETVPETDTHVDVRLLVPEPHKEVMISGVVVHVRRDPPGFGMQLSNLDHVRGQLGAIVLPRR